MRILKRNLAFVLVMAMAIGMMVTANAANVEDYRDANDIKFTEAVDVLTALGILEGEDGTFHPERTLTREEGAKIITYLMLGGDAADNLSTSVAPFADVAAGRWSAGYIAYCVSQGIVGGYGNGNFGPTDTLTGTQFAKMLLVALGYGVNGEYTGANWEIETNKQALTAGIYEGNLGVNFSNGVKREEAAQYAFNTLAKVMQVKYSDVFGAYYSGNIFDGKIEEDDEYLWTLGYNLYNLRSSDVSEGDDFGRDCHQWKANSKTITGNYHDDADAVYTDSVKSSKIYADLGLTNRITADVVVDGEDGGTFVLAKNGDDGDEKTENIAGANIGKGVVVEAYLTNNKDGDVEDVKLVVIHTYLAQVTDVNADDEEVTVDVLTGDALTSDTYETTAEYEEDDYVLITYANDEIQSMKPVNTVEGALNSTSKNFVRFDGEQRNKAKLNAIGDANVDMDNVALDTDNEYTLMVDDYGYALGLVLVEESEDTAGYVYVNSIQGRNNNLLNSNAAVAEVRYLDGKGTEVLSLETAKKTVDGEKVNCFRLNGLDKNETIEVDGHTLTAVENNWVKVADIADDDALDVNGFFAYSVNSNDELVLKIIDKDDVKVKTGKVTFDAETTGTIGDTTVRFNSRSIVHVIDPDDNIKTYTGYKNISVKDKDTKTSEVLYIETADNSGIVKEAYVLSDAKIGGNNDIFVLFRNKANDVEVINNDTVEVKLYSTDAKGQTYRMDTADYDVMRGNAGIYVITLNADDEISDVQTIAAYDAEEDITYFASETVTADGDRDGFATTDGHIFADEYTILNNDPDNGIKTAGATALKAATETKTASVVSFIENKDGEVVFVVIERDPTNIVVEPTPGE